MLLNYYTLDQSAVTPDGRNTYLFQMTSSEILEKGKGPGLEKIFSFFLPFAFHLVFDSDIPEESELTRLIERTFLIIGRENYQTSLARKILFVSYHPSQNTAATTLISKLKAHINSKIYITQIPFNDAGELVSSLNVSIANETTAVEDHFRNFVGRMVKQKTLIDDKYFYCIISSSSAVDYQRLDQIAGEQLQHAADILSVLNDTSENISQLTEKLNYAEKERHSLLNAISFLKKEVKHYFNEKEESGKADPKSTLYQHQRANDLKRKYQNEYESLPFLYKKVGILLKLMFGKVEFGYFLNRRQKQDFLDLLRTLPEDRQIEVWYYYEYEILPGWYKKLGKHLKK